MIGTIRKHSKWLWWIIAALTVISFLYWGVAPSARNGGVGGKRRLRHALRPQNHPAGLRQRPKRVLPVLLDRNNEWPDSNPNIKDKDLEEQIYLRLMLTKKADALGIYVTDEAAAAAAGEMLRSLGRNGQSVPIETFVKQVLTPKG
jgi:hypothetical protein